MNYLLPFLSIVLGFAIVLIFKPKNQRNIKLLLAFSGAFLLAMTIFTLMPEVYHSLAHDHDHDHHGEIGKQLGIWIVIGILLQIVLEFFSKGAEHGHTHHPHKDLKNAFPWTLFISLSIHSILEGFPLHHHHHMAYGIFVHHLPIAMVLTIFFLDSGIEFKRTFVFLTLFALMTPFGTFLAEYIPQLGHYHVEISAIVIGIFLHISSVILFEASENHKFNHIKLITIILGFATAYFV